MAKTKPKKPTKTKHTKYVGYKYQKPTTKNQREWNRQIERLERYEKKHKGLTINVPPKPSRVTKKALQDISAFKGKKILQQSTLTVTEADGKKVEVNAEQYLDNIIPKGTAKQREKALQQALRKKAENEPTPQTTAERAEEPIEAPTETPTESTPIENDEEWEKFFDDDKISFADSLHGMYHLALHDYENANVVEMLEAWYYAMLDELGREELTDILRDMQEDNDWINFSVSYDLKYRLNWMYRMADKVQDEYISAWLHDYVDDLSQEWLGDTAENIMNGDYYWTK